MKKTKKEKAIEQFIGKLLDEQMATYRENHFEYFIRCIATNITLDFLSGTGAMADEQIEQFVGCYEDVIEVIKNLSKEYAELNKKVEA